VGTKAVKVEEVVDIEKVREARAKIEKGVQEQ
jgi:hypothetical protein